MLTDVHFCFETFHSRLLSRMAALMMLWVPNDLHSILRGLAGCVPTSFKPQPHCSVRERERKRERIEREGGRERERERERESAPERKKQRCLNPSLWTGPALQRRPRGELRPAVRPPALRPLTPNTVELIFTLGALFPRGGPVQDPVLTPPPLRVTPSQGYLAHKNPPPL